MYASARLAETSSPSRRVRLCYFATLQLQIIRSTHHLFLLGISGAGNQILYHKVNTNCPSYFHPKSGYEILIPLLTVGHQKDPGMPKILRNSPSLPKASGRDLILPADLILTLNNLAQLSRHFPQKQRILWPHGHLHGGQHLRHLFTDRLQ